MAAASAWRSSAPATFLQVRPPTPFTDQSPAQPNYKLTWNGLSPSRIVHVHKLLDQLGMLTVIPERRRAVREQSGRRSPSFAPVGDDDGVLVVVSVDLLLGLDNKWSPQPIDILRTDVRMPPERRRKRAKEKRTSGGSTSARAHGESKVKRTSTFPTVDVTREHLNTQV
jgi:hypothetical protein